MLSPQEKLFSRLSKLHLPIKCIRIEFYDTEEGSVTLTGPEATDGSPIHFEWTSKATGRTYFLGPNPKPNDCS
jgi:hypothetical protein